MSCSESSKHDVDIMIDPGTIEFDEMTPEFDELGTMVILQLSVSLHLYLEEIDATHLSGQQLS